MLNVNVKMSTRISSGIMGCRVRSVGVSDIGDGRVMRLEKLIGDISYVIDHSPGCDSGIILVALDHVISKVLAYLTTSEEKDVRALYGEKWIKQLIATMYSERAKKRTMRDQMEYDIRHTRAN